jgi:RinA family phage transcriptional activator
MSLYREKLSRSGFRFVEKLLYDLKTYDTAIKETEAELNNTLEEITELQAATLDDMPHGTGTNSPTESYVLKRDNLQIKYLKNRIDEMKRHQQAIEKAMIYMTDTEKLLIKLMYDREKTPKQCMREMHVAKTTWYEMRRKIVYKIASHLGIY